VQEVFVQIVENSGRLILGFDVHGDAESVAIGYFYLKMRAIAQSQSFVLYLSC